MISGFWVRVLTRPNCQVKKRKKQTKNPTKTGSRDVGTFDLLVFRLKNVSKLGRDFIES